MKSIVSSSFLWQNYHRLIEECDMGYRRFLFEELNVEDRLTGLIGPRGVGKTTLLLQLIKEKLYAGGEAFYFSADHTSFNETSILAFVDELYQQHGIRYFFIDEIHKYANWSQELKNIYDSYPSAHVMFSGSSSIDLVTGSHDLSRRAKLRYLPGLSFREYLNMSMGHEFEPIAWDELLSAPMNYIAKLSQVTSLQMYFQEYLAFGYYPFVFEGRDHVYEALSAVIDKTIYEDIANFYNLKTGNLIYFKRILNFLSSKPPGRVKVGTLAKHLQIDNKTVEHYLRILEKTGLVRSLFPKAHGYQLLTKASKIYLDNTTLLTAMNSFLSGDLDVGTVRELALMQFVSAAKLPVFHSDKGDFQVKDVTIEVGGKNKTWQQLSDVKGKKLLAKDGILSGPKGEIPLWLFGFLY